MQIVRHAGVGRREGEYPDGWDCDPRFLFVGPDLEGMPLEVVAVAPEDGSLVIIHAMPLRERYQGWYAEVGKWQK